MKCAKCDVDLKEILTVIDTGVKRVVLCPNHVVGLLLRSYKFEEVEGSPSKHVLKEKCDCCENKAIYLRDSDTEFQVCNDHALKLLSKNLSPIEWKLLSQKHGEDTFLLHDDFYDEEGNALQPVG